MSVAPQNKSISAEDVMNYLAENPSFFLQNSALLTKLNLPNTVDGNVANFNDFQARKLKQKLTKYEDRIALLMRTALQNEKSAVQLNAFVLDVLRHTSLDALKAFLVTELKAQFDLDHVYFVESDFTAPEKRVTLKQVNAESVDYTLDGAGDVYSEAWLKLEDSTGETLAMLVFSSKNDQRFYDGQGDNLLDFFAQVVSHVWTRF